MSQYGLSGGPCASAVVAAASSPFGFTTLPLYCGFQAVAQADSTCKANAAANPAYGYWNCMYNLLSGQGGETMTPPPTTIPGSPNPPANYNPNTGQCEDAAGNIVPCATDTPGNPPNITIPGQQPSGTISGGTTDTNTPAGCDAWYCKYLGIGCDTCQLFSTTETVLITAVVILGGILIFKAVMK